MRLGKREKEILKLVAKGALGGYAIFDVKFKKTELYKQIMFNKESRRRFRSAITRLESKNLIVLGGERVELSKEGQLLLDNIAKQEPEIKTTEWDGVWRLISYDIPNELKNERDYFRRKLKELGFYCVQKSLWVIPYECKEEIAVFAQSLGLSPFVIYLKTDHLPGQTKLISQFNL